MTLALFVTLFGAAAQLGLCAVLAFIVLAMWKGNAGMGNMATSFQLQSQCLTAQQDTLSSLVRAVQDVVSWTVPAGEWSEVIELHQSVKAYDAERDFLIYCHQQYGYWAARDHGYTENADGAKRFTAAEALLMVLQRSLQGHPDECYTMVGIGKLEQ